MRGPDAVARRGPPTPAAVVGWRAVVCIYVFADGYGVAGTNACGGTGLGPVNLRTVSAAPGIG